MATLDVRRLYTDGEVLFAADLDAIIDDIETMLNVTRLNDDNIQNQGITASTKLVDLSVTNVKLASNAVTTTKIADANVTTAKIADSAVTTPKIADANVTTAKIADSNVTTDKLADSAVTTAKIANSNVTTAKIADLNVTTGKLADSAVTTAKLASGAVSRDKLGGGYQAYGPISFSNPSGSSAWNVGSFTSTGRPIMLVAYGGNAGHFTGGSWSLRVGGVSVVGGSGSTGGGVYSFTLNQVGVSPLAAGTHSVELHVTSALVTNLLFLIIEI